MTATRRSGGAQPPRGGVRDRILDAALASLAESGLRHFTQQQIAERAGVRQSHLTYYFPTRQDLLEALATRAVDGIATGALQAVERGSSASDAVLVSRLADAVADVGHMRMFLALIVESDGDAAVRALLVDGLERIERALADALGGDDAAARARLVLAALWGLGLHEFVVRKAAPSELRGAFAEWIAHAPTAAGAASESPPTGPPAAARRRSRPR